MYVYIRKASINLFDSLGVKMTKSKKAHITLSDRAELRIDKRIRLKCQPRISSTMGPIATIKKYVHIYRYIFFMTRQQTETNATLFGSSVMG